MTKNQGILLPLMMFFRTKLLEGEKKKNYLINRNGKSNRILLFCLPERNKWQNKRNKASIALGTKGISSNFINALDP